ncbi:MAG: hypothetical protein QG657_1492 [Acidobacteriota bacterium]|nr:hypothetical protein [Acidobacteriota bacterium]
MEKGQTCLEIAVTGMAGRFPGANNIHEFWNNVKDGKESISFFTDEELLADGLDPALLEQPHYVKASGIMAGIGYFDAPFFGYISKEAEIMDPQIRIFHECVWTALEDAAYIPESYDGLIGLFAGATPNSNWQARVVLSGKGNEIGDFAAIQLSQKDYLTLRISYKLDLKGPSFIIYTACSTSLVAIHLGCQSILNGECDTALAGGITAIRFHKRGYIYQEGMIGSPDGHCRAFDAGSKGFAAGDGVGVVVLKRLQDAIADKDHIYAVVKGSAINNDGIRKAGFTAPSVEGQAEVIKMALQMAEVEPESIGYVETHGTATPLGDPVEIEGLKIAFNTSKKGFCAIGSLKTNIGHLDCASGVAGFIKTVLILKYSWIPPSLYFEIPNPGIDFINSPFYINTKTTAWTNEHYPLRAGVSSFGQGGTNAHIILEKWPETLSSNTGTYYYLIIFSAKTAVALEQMTKNLILYLKSNHGVNIADVAYTLLVGRSNFKYRKMFVCTGIDDAISILSGVVPGKIHSSIVEEGSAPECLPESPGHLFSLIQELQTSQDIQVNYPQLFDLWEKIGHLWLKGITINWQHFYTEKDRNRISLPSYPFEKHYYWIEADSSRIVMAQDINNPGTAQPQLGTKPKKEKKYQRPELSTPFVVPANKIEITLAGIWQNFFGFDPIGINDNFFELGGDSLKIIMLVSMIQESLNTRIPIPVFFDRPTIKELSEYIQGIPGDSPCISLAPIEKKEYHELSSAQKRMFIFHQVNDKSLSYNTPLVFGLNLEIDPEKLTQGFQRLIKRHETLRTSFIMLPDGPAQVVHDDVPFKIEYFEKSGEGKITEIAANFIRPFDLATAPLLRVGLVKINAAKYILIVDMFHIISDAFSFGVLANDFMALYGDQDLAPMEIQYKDFSQWQKELYRSGVLEKQKEFWLGKFKDGDIPQLNIPIDFPRPQVRNIDKGDHISFKLDSALREKIYVVLNRTETTLPMIMFAAYVVLLFVYTRQEDIVVGMLISGRSHKDLINIIGMFVNTLPIRSFPQGNKTFEDFLKELKQIMLHAYENQDYPFDELVVDLGLQGNNSKNPLFDVVFAYNTFDNRRTKIANVEERENTIADRKIVPYESPVKFAKFDLYLQVNDVYDTLNILLRYSTQIFKPFTIEKIKKYYIEILEQAVDNIDIYLRDIVFSHDFIISKKRIQDVDDFNI